MPFNFVVSGRSNTTLSFIDGNDDCVTLGEGVGGAGGDVIHLCLHETTAPAAEDATIFFATVSLHTDQH